MDTHIEQTLPRPHGRPEMTLPGEEEDVIPGLHAEPADRPGTVMEEEAARGDKADEASDTPLETVNAAAEPTQAGPSAKHPRSRRKALMTGAAIAVVLAAAGGVFLISPYNHVPWLGGRPGPSASVAGGQTITLPAPVAPAATLARAPTPQTVANAPRPQPARQPKPEELQEIVSLRPSEGARPGPAEDPHAPTPISPPAQRRFDAQNSTPSPAAEPPAVTPAAPAGPIAPAQASLAAPPPAQAAAPSATATPPATPEASATAPHDPAQRVAALQAGPMSTPQQVEVLNLVTELGVLVRNQRTENAQLRADVQQMRERLDTQLGDYDRRLALAEARGAINAAMGAGAPSAATPAATPAFPATSSPVVPVSVTVTAPAPHSGASTSRGGRQVASAPAAPSGQDAAPRRYRVQAASPGLAMLAEVDRTGDVGNLLQISVGDDVPGYGRVKSITQQGAAWVLTAEHGTVR